MNYYIDLNSIFALLFVGVICLDCVRKIIKAKDETIQMKDEIIEDYGDKLIDKTADYSLVMIEAMQTKAEYKKKLAELERNTFTSEQIIAELLEHPDKLIDAVQNENTMWTAKELCNYATEVLKTEASGKTLQNNQKS